MASKLIFKDYKYNLLAILIICIFAIGLIVFLGFKSNEEVQNIVQEQFNKQQLLLARQSADGIEEFLDQKTSILEILADEISDETPDEMLISFRNTYNSTTGIYVIEFLNKNGTVTHGYPNEVLVDNNLIGYNVFNESEEGPFVRVRDNKETFISSPTLLKEGGLGVFIWTSVYNSNGFNGVLLVIIRISDISDRFLTNIESPREIYMIDKKGTVLYDSTGLYGSTELYDSTDSNQWKRSLIDKLGNESPRLQQIFHYQKNGSEGTGYYFGMNGSEKRLIAYSPVHWKNQRWSVAVTSPASEVDTLIRSVYVNQGMFIGVSGIFLLLGSFSIIILLTRWNKSLELEVATKTREITKSNELLRQANKKLTELDKLKSDFVSMVSHELKTPLTPMKTSAEFLLQNDPDVNIRREMLELIVRNIDRQARMVNDILDISRIESGNMKFRKEILDIGWIINSAIETVKKHSEEKNINITVDIPADLSKIKADRDKLIQVFVNLLSNALKFTHEGGNVIIKAFEYEKYMEVHVRDNGIGMPPDKIDKIFNKFYQIDNTYARPYGGSGLGLAITKSIMEGHDGTIRAESIPGEGSVFILTFSK